MKANLVKQLHQLGVYRDPVTKQKLENMKVADVLAVLNYVKEEQEKGVEFARKQDDYIFVKPVSKKDKAINKKKR